MNLKPRSKFQIYKSGKEYLFRLLAKNGKVILTGEAYATEQNCLKCIISIQNNSQHDKCYVKNKSVDNKFYFVLKASNGDIIGVSQMYRTISGREIGLNSVKANAYRALIEDLI